MNINFGIIEPLGYKIKGKREKNAKISSGHSNASKV